MDYSYNINSNILNLISKFYELHGSLYASLHLLPGDIKKELKNDIAEFSAFSVVTKNTNIVKLAQKDLGKQNILEILPKENLHYFKQYYKLLKNFEEEIVLPALSIERLGIIQAKIFGKSELNNNFRKSKKRIESRYKEDGITYNISADVKTPAESINEKLKVFINWLSNNTENINPVVLSAITYFNIACIHPFQRGNGRISKLISRRTLYENNIDTELILSIDDYFAINQHYYYQVIERAISTNNLTEWLEFYAKALLNGAIQTSELLCSLSGGSINITKQRYTALTPREMRALRIVMNESSVSGAFVARKLNTTRQNVHEILKSLLLKNLIKKVGKNTGTRYKYIG